MKEQLFEACKKYLDQRINRILEAMKDLEESLQNESKSSAGDKYETGREMINLEFDKLTTQLTEFRKLEGTLTMAWRKTPAKNIQLGSLVKTSVANYFIAIPAGEISDGNEKFYAIGANSPVAQALLGKKEKESFNFNGNTNEILLVE
ncbi:MAG: transcription elongation factor [Gillisia sp.]